MRNAIYFKLNKSMGVKLFEVNLLTEEDIQFLSEGFEYIEKDAIDKQKQSIRNYPSACRQKSLYK